jgi:hypothetical protein
LAFADRCNGQQDFFEHANCTIQVDWEDDCDMGPPWKEHDGHGVVVEFHQRDSDYTVESEQDSPLRRLSPWGFGEDDWYYDFPASLDLARRDRWGLSDEATEALALKLGRSPTDDEITEAAVQADYEHMRAWYHDEWRWMEVTVLVDARTSEGNCFLKCLTAISGIDSTYAGELLEELVTPVRAWIDENQADIAEVVRAFELQSMKRRHLPDL